MDSKQGIEKVVPVDAQAAGLLDLTLLQPEPNDTRTGPEDATAICLMRGWIVQPGHWPGQRDFVSENHTACMSGY